MKIFLKILTTIIVIPIFLVLILTSFIKLRLLNPNFWSAQYQRPDFVENIETKIDEFAEAYIKEQLIKEGVDKELLEQDFVSREVEGFTKNLDSSTTIYFLDTNTKRVLDFVNGKAKTLTFYLPLSKLGMEIDSSVLNAIEVGNDEYDVAKLFSHPSGEGLSNMFGYLTRIGTLSNILFYASLALLILFLYIYFSISKNLGSLSWFISFLGFLGLFASIPIYILQQSPGPPVNPSEPLSVLISIYYPLVLSGLVSYILTFSSITIILGVLGVVFYKFVLKDK